MKLKRFRLLISTLLVLPVILIVSACSETPDNIEETYRGTAFSALSVTANNGETVTATTVDEKNLSLVFNTADEFDKCSLTLEINPGYQLTYPEDPKNFNLADSPVIHFLNPQGRVVKYWLSVRSNSLPVIDASKIKIEGSTTTNDVTLSSATKTLTVNYALGMDMTAITLVFEQGSLLEGGSVGENNRATFDLSTGKTCELTVRMNDKQVSYRVIINFGRVMAAPSSIGLRDVTDQFVDEKSPFSVYQTATLPPVPIRNEGMPEEPQFWNYNNNYETQLNAMADRKSVV